MIPLEFSPSAGSGPGWSLARSWGRHRMWRGRDSEGRRRPVASDFPRPASITRRASNNRGSSEVTENGLEAAVRDIPGISHFRIYFYFRLKLSLLAEAILLWPAGKNTGVKGIMPYNPVPPCAGRSISMTAIFVIDSQGSCARAVKKPLPLAVASRPERLSLCRRGLQDLKLCRGQPYCVYRRYSPQTGPLVSSCGKPFQ